jgi:hypothetical protein
VVMTKVYGGRKGYMKSLTNAEIAHHFASLPANEIASIPIVNVDTGFVDDRDLSIMTEQVESYEGYDEDMKGTPSVFIKW